MHAYVCISNNLTIDSALFRNIQIEFHCDDRIQTSENLTGQSKISDSAKLLLSDNDINL